MKKYVSLILAIMMLVLAVSPVAFASTNSANVSMSVKLKGSELVYGSTNAVQSGDKISVSAKSVNADIAFVAYYFYESGADDATQEAAYNNRTKVKKASFDITVPAGAEGSTKVLWVEAVDATDDGTPNVDTKTGWQLYYLKYAKASDEEVGEVNASYNTVTLANGSTTIVEAGKTVRLFTTLDEKVETIYFKWDGGELMKTPATPYNLVIPTEFKAGSTHTLDVIAKFNNGKYSERKAYTLKIADSTTPVSGKDVNVSYAGKTLANGSTTEVEPGYTVRMTATPADRVAKIYFKWDLGQLMEVTETPYNLIIPETFEPGSTHRLDVMAKYDDGELSEQKTYYLTIPANGTNPSDNELDILPWEKENNDLETLAISLRNDSESEKANKNIYAIGEEVTYYIDFKNGGKDINDEVTIKLELPLAFKVVDADNGKVDADARTITWTYPQGMESGYEGTKTVVIKYKAFDKKSTEYKTIYPMATIAKGSKIADKSTVINLIYIDTDTVLDIVHEPYMFGDEEKPTFRPDDTITRAEGALVLTRILLGQDAIDRVKVTSVYPDLDETYLEAQKAIIAATQYGIINGYTDGYYRPNQIMTRAEFMKIIAKFVELNAEDDGIDGLEIKNIEELVKLYKNPVIRYTVNGSTVSTHWAIEEVTFLNRLNMTDVSNNKNLRLDEGISRAEVAQLVNFYTFRAPAEINSRTTTQFTDVSRKHKLFADIVEATRDTHEVKFTEDGTEIAK